MYVHMCVHVSDLFLGAGRGKEDWKTGTKNSSVRDPSGERGSVRSSSCYVACLPGCCSVSRTWLSPGPGSGV